MTFYICQIQVENADIITIKLWEKELFKQLREVLASCGEDSDFVGVSYSQETDNIIEEVKQDQSRLGTVFTCRRNMSRSEVFPNVSSKNENLEKSFIEIIDGICTPDNPKCSAYHDKVRSLQEEQGRLKASIRNTEGYTDTLHRTYKEKSKDCYAHGYSKQGTSTADLMGGGNLPLDAKSAYALGIAIFDAIPKDYIEKRETFWIYWVGCGYGEEILLIVMLAVECGFFIHIMATDINEVCVDHLKRLVTEKNLVHYITVEHANLYATKEIDNKYNLVYTSACIEPIFSSRLLYLSLMSKASYLLCNHDHCQHLVSMRVNDEVNQCIKDRRWVVEACLEKDQNNKGFQESRNIYALELGKDKMREVRTLSQLHDALSSKFWETFANKFGRLEYGNFTPPTGRNWSAFTSFLTQGCTQSTKNYTINIELYDPVHSECESKEQGARNSRTYALRLDRSEFQSTVDHVRSTLSDSQKIPIYCNFWQNHIYNRASEIWKKQRVLNLPQANKEIDSEVVSENSPSVYNKVTFQFIDSCQLKDVLDFNN